MFAATPDFRSRLESEHRSYFYYTSACSFLKDWLARKHSVMPLPLLTKAHNEELLRSIHSAHQCAYPWDAVSRVTDDLITFIVQEARKQSLMERELIKAFVTILEICQQHPDCDPAKRLANDET